MRLKTCRFLFHDLLCLWMHPEDVIGALRLGGVSNYLRSNYLQRSEMWQP